MDSISVSTAMFNRGLQTFEKVQEGIQNEMVGLGRCRRTCDLVGLGTVRRMQGLGQQPCFSHPCELESSGMLLKCVAGARDPAFATSFQALLVWQ